MSFTKANERIKAAKSSLDEFQLVDIIMQRFGMRFADVAQIKGSDIIDEQTVFFAARKNGYDRWECIPDLVPTLQRLDRLTQTKTIFSVNYNQFYRWSIKKYTTQRKKGKRYNVVTHRHRNAFAKKLHKSGLGAKDSISRRIGQRSNKSLEYYIKE